MAFNNYGLFFIWNSSKMRVIFGDGNDYGAHWIMADPRGEPGYGGNLTVGEFAKLRIPNYVFPSGEFTGLKVFYEATVTNTAGYAQWFTLQGGGNT